MGIAWLALHTDRGVAEVGKGTYACFTSAPHWPDAARREWQRQNASLTTASAVTVH